MVSSIAHAQRLTTVSIHSPGHYHYIVKKHFEVFLSFRQDIALIRNNAGVGGQVAVELSRQRKARKRREERSSLPAQEGGGGGVCGDWKKGGVVIVGASILDWTARILSPQVMVRVGITHVHTHACTHARTLRLGAELLSLLFIKCCTLANLGVCPAQGSTSFGWSVQGMCVVHAQGSTSFGWSGQGMCVAHAAGFHQFWVVWSGNVCGPCSRVPPVLGGLVRECVWPMQQGSTSFG